ncbi:hypothetical protein KAW80_00800 [Candidatus Babeliales bacterium]|nr:hypothetical protein [Candidatus Babeliales bacterium]
MSQPLWSKLVALVNLDKELSELNDQIKVASEIIKANEGQIKTLENNLLKSQNVIDQQKKSIKLVERKLEEIDAVESKKKKTLEFIKNSKEYEAFEKELGLISIERQDQEDILIKELQDLENSEKKLDVEKKLLENESEKKTTEINGIKEKIETLLKSTQEIESKKNDQASDIPNEWLTTYEKMRSRVSDPIVPLINSSCSHCYYHVLAQDLIKIKNGKLLHCKSCFRLLYYKATDDSATTPSGIH